MQFTILFGTMALAASALAAPQYGVDNKRGIDSALETVEKRYSPKILVIEPEVDESELEKRYSPKILVIEPEVDESELEKRYSPKILVIEPEVDASEVEKRDSAKF